MLASELILKLNDLIKDHGDLSIFIDHFGKTEIVNAGVSYAGLKGDYFFLENKSPFEWTTVSEPGAVITVKTAPLREETKKAMARALELGKAATNTNGPVE